MNRGRRTGTDRYATCSAFCFLESDRSIVLAPVARFAHHELHGHSLARNANRAARSTRQRLPLRQGRLLCEYGTSLASSSFVSTEPARRVPYDSLLCRCVVFSVPGVEKFELLPYDEESEHRPHAAQRGRARQDVSRYGKKDALSTV